MRKLSLIVGAPALVLASACGGSATGPTKPDNTIMSARIDGAAWSAVSVTTDTDAASSIVIQGSNATQRLAIAIPVNQGVGKQVVGSPTPVYAVLVNGSQWWAASRTQGGAGSITLTTVVPGHIVGTFEFTVAAHEGASPAERRVSSGRFDVKY